jgi:transcriptional regulator with XRE-family HTH domain
MPHTVDEQIARISRRIRRWREDDALTLQELASRGGLATSTVQKVETGQMTPSLAVLLKLAHGLGRPLAELLEEDDLQVEVFHSKACERETVGGGGSLVVERLSGNLQRPSLETWQVALDPGVSSGSDPIQYDGEELVVCEEGFVTFRVGEQEYPLHAGDSLHFKASIPHSWYNDGPGPARFTITGTMPPLFRSLMQSRVPAAQRPGHPEDSRPVEHVEEHLSVA